MSSDLKLSQAIRLGSMLSPQARGTIERTRRKYIFFGPVVRETCALGAAFEAANVGFHERIQPADGSGFRGQIKAGEKTQVMGSPSHWPMWHEKSCPFCGVVEPLNRLVPHLNDTHGLTRDLIADFVEQTEDRIEATRREFEALVARDETEDELGLWLETKPKTNSNQINTEVSEA